MVKCLVTASILAFLFSSVGVEPCMAVIADVHPAWFVAAVAASGSAFFTSMLRWRALLRGVGVRAEWTVLLKALFVGFFASAFLPGTVSGDAVRCKLVAHDAGGYLRAGATILMDRVVGVTSMVGMGIVIVAVDMRRLATPPVLVLIVLATCLLALGLILAGQRRAATIITFRTRRGRFRPITRLLYRLQREWRSVPRDALARAMFWSVVFNVGSGAFLYFSCAALSAPISLFEATAVTVIVSLFVLLPFSVGGLGLRQLGDVHVLGLMGVDPAKALTVSLLNQIINYGFTLVGGVLFLRDAAARANHPAGATRGEPLQGPGSLESDR